MTTLDDLSDPVPPPGPADWNDDGVVLLERLIPDDLIQAYLNAWAASNNARGLIPAAEAMAAAESPRAALDDPSNPGGVWMHGQGNPEGLYVIRADRPGGWPDACPYMRFPALLELCMYAPLADALQATVGEPMGLHLNLTGMTSTLRNWHQDGYLNPAPTGDFYAAVWIALDDIHPDAGVFQFVPGSHRWHRITHEKIAKVVDVDDPRWPTLTEDVLTPLVDAEIKARGAQVVDYQPNRGDVLLWHPRLYHRGSTPLVKDAYRPALIAHYSGINHRPDFPVAVERHPMGGWYWPLLTEQPVR